MDQFTPFRPYEDAEHKNSARGRALKRLMLLILVLTALGAGYRLGQEKPSLRSWLPASLAGWLGSEDPAAPAPTGPVIYYRDPDGKPVYAAEPRKTDDGRDYLPVRASEDVSFEEQPQTAAGDAGDKADRKILYYRHPMGLPDTSPVPKKDSMGMDYIPVYEGEEEDGTTIKVSLGKLQRTGVRSEPAARRVLSLPVRAPGTIQLDERRVAVVSLRSASFIEKVENVTTGDRVRKGQPLMRLYSPDIAAASAQYLSVLNWADGPRSGRPPLIEGARQRLENLGTPAAVMAEIDRTRKVPLTITWSAPRDGIVLERTAVEGMRAEAGDTLFRLADMSVIWALIDVAERDLPTVGVGQGVAVRPRGYVDRVFKGKLTVIYPEINRETRTARVRVELANPDGVLLPDMYVDAEIATGADKPVVAVPTSAVVDSGTRQVVIIDKGEGRFEPREVKLGRRGEGYVGIRDGVSEGDQVVVSANFLIDAESNLKAALRGLSAGDQPQ